MPKKLDIDVVEMQIKELQIAIEIKTDSMLKDTTISANRLDIKIQEIKQLSKNLVSKQEQLRIKLKFKKTDKHAIQKIIQTTIT